MSFGYCQKTTTSKWEEENHKNQCSNGSDDVLFDSFISKFDAIVGKYPI